MKRTSTRIGRGGAAAVVLLMAGLTTGACASGPGTRPEPSGPASATIPQPSRPDLPLAPDSRRVDMARPTFSNPLKITNPLFPVSAQTSVLHLGNVEGEPLRTEVTTLPFTRIIEWDGQRIETRTSQYNAFVGGRIVEAAIDWYAQADDGSVWYFGEDVFRYADGVAFDTDGTWFTGKDGPAAMIMPGTPAVGQVFRPENIPGLAFEEVSVGEVDKTLDGPRGPVPGGLVVKEIHRDGTTSDKFFAPGYGEFQTGSATELETMALVVPADALPGPVPTEVAAIASSAAGVFDATRTQDWAAATTQLDALRTAWTAVRGGDVPAKVRESLDGWLTALTVAVTARDQAEAGQAAIDAHRGSAWTSSCGTARLPRSTWRGWTCGAARSSSTRPRPTRVPCTATSPPCASSGTASCGRSTGPSLRRSTR